jgi:hypothetical protein
VREAGFGTNRTSGHVRLRSAFRGKTEVGFRTDRSPFDPGTDILGRIPMLEQVQTAPDTATARLGLVSVRQFDILEEPTRASNDARRWVVRASLSKASRPMCSTGDIRLG